MCGDVGGVERALKCPIVHHGATTPDDIAPLSSLCTTKFFDKLIRHASACNTFC